MPTKKVSELKVKDQFETLAYNSKMAYISFVTIVKINAIKVYDQLGKRREIVEFVYKPNKGPLKNEEMSLKLYDDEIVTVPPRPGKFRRVWKELMSD